MKVRTRIAALVCSLFVAIPTQAGAGRGADESSGRVADEGSGKAVPAAEAEASQGGPNMVRLAKIVVDSAQLGRYRLFLEEEIEASTRLEPGVLGLYAVADREHPNRITILEVYADRQAYLHHIQTPHFQKYKQGTLEMVQQLELVDVDPLIPGSKIR